MSRRRRSPADRYPTIESGREGKRVETPRPWRTLGPQGRTPPVRWCHKGRRRGRGDPKPPGPLGSGSPLPHGLGPDVPPPGKDGVGPATTPTPGPRVSTFVSGPAPRRRRRQQKVGGRHYPRLSREVLPSTYPDRPYWRPAWTPGLRARGGRDLVGVGRKTSDTPITKGED